MVVKALSEVQATVHATVDTTVQAVVLQDKVVGMMQWALKD